MHDTDEPEGSSTPSPGALRAQVRPQWPLNTGVAVIAGVAVLHLAALALHIPLFETFFLYVRKPMGDALSLGLIGLGTMGLVMVVRSRLHGARYLAVLMLLSVLLQHGFSLTEGRGLDALRERTVTTGHAEFAELAVGLPDTLAVMSAYEDLVRQGMMGRFGPSKPPGTLLLYMLTERISALFAGPDRLSALFWAITYIWPVLATLAVVPLYFLARTLFGATEARLGAALYITAPSVNLVQLHTDQAFFPALFGLSLLLLVRTALAQAQGRRIDGPALAAGAVVYGAAFFQLPLVFATVIVFGMVAAERWVQEPRPVAQAKLLEFTGMVAAGFAAAAALGWVALGYNPVIRYIVAMGYHGHFKAANLPFLSPIGFSNLAEFFTWSGLPLVGLVVVAVWLSLRHWRTGDRIGPDRLLGLAAALGLVLLYFAFFTKTISEVARLWIFLLPLLCVLAGRGAVLLGWSARAWPVTLVLLLQLATVYLTKVHQDFY